VHPGDLAGGFSDLEMTWLLYCAVAATGSDIEFKRKRFSYLTETITEIWSREHAIAIKMH